MRWRALGLALALACAAALPTQAVETGGTPVPLDRGDVRAAALNALDSGDTATAIAVARALLRSDPEDPVAYFILAMAHGTRGETGLSRKAAAYAYRYSEAPEDRLRAGQIAAQAAFRESRFGLAQFWLRRSALHADDAAEKQVIARDYRALRRLNPWSLRLDMALRPSSNVNNGSEDALQIIDGSPVTGELSGSAQALSGLIGTVDLSLSYRLDRSERRASFLGLRAYTRQVWLSDSARQQAPDVSNDDLSQHYLETAFTRAAALSGGIGKAGAAIGQAWSANAVTYRFARLTAERTWTGAGNGMWYGLGAGLEERMGADGPRYDATAYSLSMRAGRTLENGDRLALTLGLRDTDAWFANSDGQSASLRAAYSFAEPLGPVQIDLSLTLGYSEYPDYTSGIVAVPGGRRDRSAYADIDLTFETWDYGGFAPALKLRAGRTNSNDSRFQTREFSVGVGIRSTF